MNNQNIWHKGNLSESIPSFSVYPKDLTLFQYRQNICGIRAIPFHSSHIKLAAKICRHCHYLMHGNRLKHWFFQFVFTLQCRINRKHKENHSIDHKYLISYNRISVYVPDHKKVSGISSIFAIPAHI